MNHFSKQNQSDFLYVCMYVCMCICICVYIYIHIYVCMYVCISLIPGTPNILVPGERLVFILFMQLLCNYTAYIYIYIYKIYVCEKVFNDAVRYMNGKEINGMFPIFNGKALMVSVNFNDFIHFCDFSDKLMHFSFLWKSVFKYSLVNQQFTFRCLS